MASSPALDPKTGGWQRVIREKALHVVAIVLGAAVVFLGGWVWRVEGRVLVLETEARLNVQAEREFRTELLKRLDRIDERLDRVLHGRLGQ